MADEWYYTNQGKQVGPVNETLLKQLASSNFLRPSDLVWKQGYPQWIPASSIPGLFVQQQTRPAAAPSSGSYPAPAAAAGSESYEYREPGGDSAYDDEYYQERRRRRKSRNKTGVPMGLIIGLVVGGGFALILIIGIIVWAVSPGNKGPGGGGVFGGGGANNAGPDNKTGNGSYYVPHLALNPEGKETLNDHHKVWLNAGTTVTINVKSEVGGDVDCYLDNPQGKQIAADNGLSKDCFLQVGIVESGYYNIVLDNLGHSANRCTVTYSSK